MSDWFRSSIWDTAPSSQQKQSKSKPSIDIRLVVDENGQFIGEANPQIPVQLARVLLQPAQDRSTIYVRRTDLRNGMESLVGTLVQRNKGEAERELSDDQIVPEQAPQQTYNPNGERDSLGISITRVVASAARSSPAQVN